MPSISTTLTVVLFSGKYTTKECSVWKPRNANTMVTKEGEKTKECNTNRNTKDSYILVEEIQSHG